MAHASSLYCPDSPALTPLPALPGKKRRPASTDIMAAIRCTDVQFVSFLEGCLRWDHAERFTPEDGLQHEWILEAARIRVRDRVRVRVRV